jgi:hypothetical protein
MGWSLLECSMGPAIDKFVTEGSLFVGNLFVPRKE